jgi:hypothetical protein
MAAPTSNEPPADDEARRLLERELYWAGDPRPSQADRTSELRIALQDFAAVVRADEHAPIPREEPQLGSPTMWKRRFKASMYQALRPVTHRYDRLIADLATMTRSLADRLAEAEAEIERLRAREEGDRGADR